MKILFVSQDIEYKARGINVILKGLIKAARSGGHEIGLLVGTPTPPPSTKEKSIRDKVEVVNTQHYLNDGLQSFKYLLPNGYGRKGKLLFALKLIPTKATTISLKNTEFTLSPETPLINDLDFVIKSPAVYQLLASPLSFVAKRNIKKSIKKEDVDLVICAAPTGIMASDVRPAKLAQFIHDTMPIELVETPGDDATPVKFAELFSTAVRESDLVLANSEDTARKVQEIEGASQTHVLYGIASSAKEEVSRSSILENRGLVPEKYYYFVSAIEERKNLINLFDAYAQLDEKVQFPLVISGGAGYGFEKIYQKHQSLSPSVQDKIIFTGYVTNNEKATLMENALAFLFPSIYEGLGLVIIEAMQHNTPVLASDKGGLSEVGGNACLYVKDPYNSGEIADKITELASNRELREKLVKTGKTQIDKFTQKNFNKRFDDALNKL